MNSFDNLKSALRKLPSTGAKSAERMAIFLTLENRLDAKKLADSIVDALEHITPCPLCGALSEDDNPCDICSNVNRAKSSICVVEKASDIEAIEKSGAWTGKYHVLGGKLSPLKRISPDKLNLKSLQERIESGVVEEIMLALSNDIEGQATCIYIQDNLIAQRPIQLTRIGFGLPSGSQLSYADADTIKNALDSRTSF